MELDSRATDNSLDAFLEAPQPEPSARVGEVFLDQETIARRVRELGAQITADYQGQDLLLISVLKGAVFFIADLARAIDLPVEIDFLAISSYSEEHVHAGTRAIRFLKDLDHPIKNRNVLIVEDMIDSGLTLHYIMRSLVLRRPRSLEICTLLDRPHLRLVDLPVRYRGFEVPDDFFVGYGFDFRQLYRNLPYVAYLELEPEQPTLF
ncbi:MAG: hypoxanthine phosphoribosyltransferase [Thermoleophilia bacterium]|nr:hypoxanthine phosphoribosyltransferase [Thermoleophilia bacterium]